MDDKRHNLGRFIACGAPLLVTNLNYIGREILEGERTFSDQLNFPDTSRLIGPVVPITTFDFVAAGRIEVNTTFPRLRIWVKPVSSSLQLRTA